MDTIFSSLRAGAGATSPFERSRLAAMPPSAPRAPEPGVLGSAMLTRVLDQLDYGVMLATDQGRVCFANRVALGECGAAQPLRIADGHLYARDDREQHGLARALAASRNGRRTMVTFTSVQPSRTVAVVPVQEAASEPTALVVFARRQVCEPLSVELFAREHHLTVAETAVLRGLANGLRPMEIARDGGVAMSTVRTQITSIRLKTGVRSIGDLVRMVTVLPPIVPALGAACRA